MLLDMVEIAAKRAILKCEVPLFESEEVSAYYGYVGPEVLQDLVLHSKGAVIQTLDSFPVINGAISIARSYIQDMFTVIDDYIVGIPYLPSDPVDTQARGLGNMIAFWERMRNICPKVNTYNGPIVMEDGAQCLTSKDLDAAMLSTRAFWFERPVEQDERWTEVLHVYRTSEMWPEIWGTCASMQVGSHLQW